jgi:hypothetical protein
MLETLELFVAVVVALIMLVVLYAANYIQAFTSPWAVLFGVIILGAGKIWSSMISGRPAMFIYWNIVYGVLLLLASFLLTYTDVDKANYGTFILLVASFIDVCVTAYLLTLLRKAPSMDANSAYKKTDAMQSKMPEGAYNAGMLSAALVIVGDVILFASFAYAYSQT